MEPREIASATDRSRFRWAAAPKRCFRGFLALGSALAPDTRIDNILLADRPGVKRGLADVVR